MRGRLVAHAWTIVGSLVIATGSTLAGLYAFEGNVPVVMFGFLVFIVGYRLSQVGTHAGGDGVLRGAVLRVRASATPESFVRGALLFVGWLCIALGVTRFSQTILDPSLSNAALSGVSSIGGYMAAHVGINGVGLGDSVFGPVLERLSGTEGGSDRWYP